MTEIVDAKTRTKPAKVPLDVIRQLVAFGIPAAVARRMHPRVAFARLYALREGGMSVSEQNTVKEQKRLAALLRQLASEHEPCPKEVTDASLEALCVLPPAMLKRVASGLANVLEEQAKTAA